MSTVSTTLRPLSIEPTDDRLAGNKFFYLRGLDPATGDCLCPRGSWHLTGEHGESYGGSGSCGNPGKHPWWIRRGADVKGFRHGVKDALPYAELLAQYGPAGGLRRLAMNLSGIMMLDIDNPRALQTFWRIRAHVPKQKLLGIAKTPRGWHLYLQCDPVWNQKALAAQMRSWLGDGYAAVDAGKIPLQGFLLDVRTGEGRYAVWPTGDRHWASAAQFRSALNFAGLGMPSWWVVQDGSAAPWNIELTEQVRAEIVRAGVNSFTNHTPLAFDGTENDRVLAWTELERWSTLIRNMRPESGRNNTLNQTAFYAGADAIAAGHSYQAVADHLLAASRASQTPGARATIASGLTSGLSDRHGVR